jgi:hypothetical protein
MINSRRCSWFRRETLAGSAISAAPVAFYAWVSRRFSASLALGAASRFSAADK